MTKFCSDCKFCRPTEHKTLSAYKFARCARPREKPDGYSLTHPDNQFAGLEYCRVERECDNLCATEAKFFIAKTEG